MRSYRSIGWNLRVGGIAGGIAGGAAGTVVFVVGHYAFPESDVALSCAAVIATVVTFVAVVARFLRVRVDIQDAQILVVNPYRTVRIDVSSACLASPRQAYVGRDYVRLRFRDGSGQRKAVTVVALPTTAMDLLPQDLPACDRR